MNILWIIAYLAIGIIFNRAFIRAIVYSFEREYKFEKASGYKNRNDQMETRLWMTATWIIWIPFIIISVIIILLFVDSKSGGFKYTTPGSR